MKDLVFSYRIRALTNLHAGSGEENYGLIDKLVQRDVLTGFPCIHPSSLKGALKQYLDARGMDSESLRMAFGSDAQINKAGKAGEYQTGEFAFLGARLLSLPVATDKHTYVQVTCPMILSELLDVAGQFGAEGIKLSSLGELLKAPQPSGIGCQGKLDLWGESLEVKPLADALKPAEEELASLIGEKPVVLVSNELFKALTNNQHLPVIARNALDNGESVNLWYEQVLPRQTTFLTWILVPGTFPGAVAKKFDDHCVAAPVQIGGNASVGYGFTVWSRLHPELKHQTHEKPQG